MTKYIIGIDEAGRGPLAGPLVAAGVIFRGLKKEQTILALVKDSKQLSVQQREDLFLPIIKNFIWSVALLDNNFIDRYGIQAANILLVKEVADDLSEQAKQPTRIVADYVGGAGRILRQIDFYKQGEDKFKEIAAASIVAKVYRDKLMEELDKTYPDYNFSRHKGYGTKEHFDNLRKFGQSTVHRKSFLNNLLG